MTATATANTTATATATAVPAGAAEAVGAGGTGLAGLGAALLRLDLRLRLVVEAQREVMAERARDPFRGLYISEDAVDALLAAAPSIEEAGRFLESPVAAAAAGRRARRRVPVGLGPAGRAHRPVRRVVPARERRGSGCFGRGAARSGAPAARQRPEGVRGRRPARAGGVPARSARHRQSG